jgi:valyl-tRNA synthetase
MSKSLGTGIDPIELIDQYGADATRFGLLAMSSTQDVRFNEDKIAQGAQLANKLWNASRLILTRANDAEGDAVEDRWILSRLERAKELVTGSIERFEFHHAALGLYDFVYGELCDWYLEIVKPRLETEGGVALRVLRETLALAHPIIPFVTEEIWSHLDHRLLAQSSWPAADPERLDIEAEERMSAAIDQVRAIRTWRDELEVRPGAVLPARLDGEGEADIIARLARLDWADGEPVARVGTVQVLASDDVDLEAGAQRVAKRREALEDDIAFVARKLDNPKFVEKAPADVVAKERDKLAALRAELERL